MERGGAGKGRQGRGGTVEVGVGARISKADHCTERNN